MQFFLVFCEKMSGKLRFGGRAGLKTPYIKLWSISNKKYIYVEPALGAKQGLMDNLKKAFGQKMLPPRIIIIHAFSCENKRIISTTNNTE